MELTTSEDIHLVCLFEQLEAALEFDSEILKHRILIPNRVDIFGEQKILDGLDELISTEPYLLSNATDISVDEAPALVSRFGGICYPAHVDREANGLISVLGTFPAELPVHWAELHDMDSAEAYAQNFPALQGKGFLFGSDAHYLWDIPDKRHYFELEDEPYSSALIRKRLFAVLRGGAR